MTTDITRIDLLRHGACEGGEIFRGLTDVNLTETGKQQMQTGIERLEQEHNANWQKVITSPLQRCVRFAESIATQRSLPLHIEESFKEMSFGHWDGKAIADVLGEEPKALQNFWQDPVRCTPPGGEPFAEFNLRLQNAWDTLIQNHQGQSVLLVCHGGVIRALIGQLLELPGPSLSKFNVGYGAISRVEIHHMQGQSDWPQLVFHRG